MADRDEEEAFQGDFAGLEPIRDQPLATGPSIAAIALSLALKYHDINTVQDGVLYQQYKMDGKNLQELHLDMVFETAIRMEEHLLGASDRIAKLVVEAVVEGVKDRDEDDGATGGVEGHRGDQPSDGAS